MSKAAKRERQRQNRERAREERQKMVTRQKRGRFTRGLLFVLVPVIALFVVLQVVNRNDGKSSSSTTTTTPAATVACGAKKPSATPKQITDAKAPANQLDPAKSYTATISTSCGDIVLALDTKTAPVASNNFIWLAQQGYYDGAEFYRAAKDFVIQGGQNSSPGYTVPGEVPTDSYPVGSLAAAKAGSEAPGTFGGDFFIVTGANGASLPNDYARFGNVTSGLDVAQKIEKLAPPTGDGQPTQTVYIDKLSITESPA